MTLLQRAFHRQKYRWTILVVVGLLGLLITGWVTWMLFESDKKGLEQRFQSAAQSRADAISEQIRQPLDHLATLQRLFGSFDQIDWPAFKKFTEPMLSYPGVSSFDWFPRVTAVDRSSFERSGRRLWGDRFAIEDRDADDKRIPSAIREVYFPLLYSVPEELGKGHVGFDIYSVALRAQQIDRTIDGNLPTASEIGPLFVNRKLADITLLILPVYRSGIAPATLTGRRAEASGIVVAIVRVGKLFAAANGSLSEIGFNVRLLDLKQVPEKQLLATWNSRPTSGAWPANEKPLIYSKNIDLASHTWSVQIEATPEWLEINRSHGLYFVPLFGVLVSALLLSYLRSLLRRSALVDSLEVTNEENVEQRRVAEAWAYKLSMAVEQNPATIFITDLDGCIEYVNAMFVETTGYSREEAIGQNARILAPETTDESAYRALWKTISSGHNWQGDMQNQRRDGTLYWERVLISPIKDRDGTVTNFMAIKENVTELREIMVRLQESESRFRGAMSVMVEGLAILSPEGVFIFGNRAAEEFLGCVDTGLIGKKPLDLELEMLRDDGSLCPPEIMPSFISRHEGREVRGFVMGHRYANGTVRWFQISSSPLRGGKTEHFGVVLTLSDITDRRLAEEQLKLADAAIRYSGEGILVTDADQRIISVNPAFVAVTGYSAEEVTGKTPAVFSSNRHDESFFETMREILDSTGHWQGEVWNHRKNGEIYPEWLGVSEVRKSDGRPKYFVYIFSDMTERNETQQRIEFLAHHDPLTGLPNRLLLRDRVEQARAQATRMQSRVALMFLDLDRFKTINDSLGHPVGDVLLKEVVERLRSCVRESDTVSRQGGDEFIILLNDVRDSEAVSRVADKIHVRMSEPFVIRDNSLITSFSIGIALFPDDGEDFDSLLQKADTAMYHAKESGRNSHRFFTEQMNLQVVEHLTLETQLRHALENNEFILHYQPQMDLQEGVIVGVEALIRWNSPDKGLMSPAKFIPVAEESGLIVPIGAWVLGKACRQAKAWQDAGLPPFVVAVNLSAIQFRRLDLVNTVINALVLSDLDSQWLELELTESILIQDAEATLDTVRRLKALGVKLSVDDFGTGYSSLTYLKRFAVDKLKIDQTFVRDLVTDPDDAAIVRAIIQMARSLKLKTIAEGVETEELSNLLRIFHCDEIQGFWLARPMPADDLEAFVRDRLAKCD
jgi:diguanylate cyclase (GGDEF)-like protein/PAS domain S-box-containing protein